MSASRKTSTATMRGTHRAAADQVVDLSDDASRTTPRYEPSACEILRGAVPADHYPSTGEVVGLLIERVRQPGRQPMADAVMGVFAEYGYPGQISEARRMLRYLGLDDEVAA